MSTDRHDRRALFALTFALFALVGRGTFFSSDEGGIFNTAAALVERGNMEVPPGEGVHPGRDGKQFSRRELLPTLLTIPFYEAGAVIHRLHVLRNPPVAPAAETRGGTNWPIFVSVTFLGPLCMAAVVVMVFAYARRDGASRGHALLLALVAAWATPLSVYSKTLFAHICEIPLLIAAFLLCRQWRSLFDAKDPNRLDDRRRESAALSCAAWMGAMCGLFVTARPAAAPAVGCFFIYLAFVGRMRLGLRVQALCLLTLPIALGTAAVLGLNWYRWGSPLDFGYHSPEFQFSTGLWTGLTGLLLSPGKSLFLYAPVVLVPLLFARSICRRAAAEWWLAAGLTATYIVVSGRWAGWTGDLAWGPRFLVPVIPLWVALLGSVIERPLVRCGVWCAAITGFLVQIPGLVTNIHWVNDINVDPFVLPQSHLVLYFPALFAHGVDDLWLWGGYGNAPRAYMFLTAVLATIALRAGRRLLSLQGANRVEHKAPATREDAADAHRADASTLA